MFNNVTTTNCFSWWRRSLQSNQMQRFQAKGHQQGHVVRWFPPLPPHPSILKIISNEMFVLLLSIDTLCRCLGIIMFPIWNVAVDNTPVSHLEPRAGRKRNKSHCFLFCFFCCFICVFLLFHVWKCKEWIRAKRKKINNLGLLFSDKQHLPPFTSERRWVPSSESYTPPPPPLCIYLCSWRRQRRLQLHKDALQRGGDLAVIAVTHRDA